MTKQEQNSVKPSTDEKLNYEPIAIVGMGCRFPGGANDPYQFWDNIKNGVDCLEPTPRSRWNTDAYYSKIKNKKGKMNTQWGGYIDGFDEFDPLFFGISPREADYIDPQQRKLLEVTWEAIEEGGFKPSALSEKAVGVFIGGFTVDYKILQFTNPDFNNIDAHTATGVMMTMLSNRISYIYNFKGPSLSVDTACSSSLVAIDLACRNLQQGDSEIALAGGVLMTFAPQYTVSETQGGFLSPTGSSHAFSATANGYVRSEGVGVVLLKKLSQAEADGDHIHAVILGSAVNQDGRTNGITVPSPEAQYNLMTKAYQRAKVSPSQVQYIEVHGTGTPVGDPVEAQSVGRLLSTDRRSEDRCYIGSVKTNIGHTEAAAGTAALIKTVMALKHQQIPPHLHFKTPNPKIAFDQYPYIIPTELTPWPDHEGLALAGINSFGFGGTNAHVVLREYRPKPIVDALLNLERPKLFSITHADKDSLIRQAQAYYDHIQPINDETELYHLGYSSACIREPHPHRALFVYNNKAQLLERLDNYIKQQSIQGIYLERQQQHDDLKVVWVLTGMGPQWWAMGHELYKSEPVYRDTLDKIDQEFSKWVDWSLKDELFATEEQSKMAETWLAQTANFAVQVGLAELWRSYGIHPDAIVGHSTGEVAAFYLAGVYSLEDAVKIVVHRSRLQHLTRGLGKMLAVGLSEQQVAPYLAGYTDKVSIGAINSPNAVTLTGDTEALKAIAEKLEANELFNKFLRVEVPYHSVIMEQIKDELLSSLAEISPQSATIPLYSTVSGQKVDGAELDAEYWWQNVRQPVAFAKAIETLFNEGYQYFLEIGPHPVLAASIGEIAESLNKDCSTFYSIRRKNPEQEDFYGSLARLYGLGFSIDWNTMYPNGHFVRMPRYQWRRDKHWYETPFYQRLRQGVTEHPLLGLSNAQTHNLWDSDISLEKYPYLNDHVIQDSCLFPAAGYVEMIYGALHQHWGDGFYSIDELKIDKGVFLSEDKNPQLKLSIDETDSHFKIISTTILAESEEHPRPTVQEDRHISGFIRCRASAKLSPRVDLEFERLNSFKSIDKQACYTLLEKFNYQYGPCFQPIEALWLGHNQVLAKIVLPMGLDTTSYHLHPSLLDGCLQTLLFNEIDKLSDDDQLVGRLPVAIRQVNINPKIPKEFWCLTKIIQYDEEKIVGDLMLCDADGTVLGSLIGFNAQAVDTVASGMNTHTIDSWLYQPQWALQTSDGIEHLGLKKAYLLFADLGGTAQLIAQKLREQGCEVCVAVSGYAYTLADDFSQATLEPDNVSHLRQCLQAFYERYGANSGLIHCLGLDETPSFDIIHIREFETVKETRLHSLLFIAKVMIEMDVKSKLWVLTRNGQVVSDNDAGNLNMISASLSGISRVLAQHELCDNWGGHIDLAGDDIVDHLLSELSLKSEEEVSYRQQQRYVSRLLPPTELKPPFPVRLQANACYLVAGGFGAIGRLVCRWLINKGARRLLLITRTAFPNRDSWKLIDSEHQLYDRISFINEMEAMGTEVILADLDISRERDLRYYFDHFEQQGYPPIRGVFFCSGVVKDTLISSIERQDFNDVYDTKTIGAMVLHQCLADAPLDYFVLFSSIAAQVTTAGQANYAAANSFLDALAHYRCAQGLPALSINWGPWAIGMIKKLGLGDHYKNQRGMPPILPEAGIKVLERILELPNPQFSVCDARWDKVLDWYPKKPCLFKELVSEEHIEKQTDDFLSRYAQCEAAQRASLVENELKELIAHILRTDGEKIDVNNSLVALGIDSIMGVELNNRILAHFGERLSVVKLLGNLNIGKLAAELNSKIAILSESRPSSSGDEIQANEAVQPDNNGLNSANPFADLEIEDEYPLSFGQKAIWFTHQLNPQSAAYNIGGVMHIPSTLNLEVLEKAINGVVQRHQGLRANFYVVDGEPVQRIYAERKYHLSVIEGKDWETIRQQVIVDNQQPFDLETEPLFRIRLYCQADDSYYFAITIYHIVSDAWSNYMFLNEMQSLYARYLNEEQVTITPTKFNYRHFVEWETRLINSIRGSGLYKFWRNRLPADIPQIALPTDKKRPTVMTNNGASYNFVINATLTAQLQNLAKSEGATMFMALLSIYFTLMHKYTQQNDIIIGSPVAGRTQANFADIYGYFVNPLPQWARFDGNPSFIELLNQVRDTTLMGLEHQEFPFSLLVDRLEMEHDPSHSAIFQVMFVLLNHQVDRSHIDENNVAHYEGFPMRLLQMPEEEGQFDITLSVYEEKGVYYATLKYNTDLFVESTMARMAGHFLMLVEQAIAQPTEAVSNYHLLTAEEQQVMLNQWSGASDQNREQGSAFVHERIQAFAHRIGEHPAVQMTDDEGHSETLSYAELNARANQIAHYLLEQGVSQGSVVGLYLEKSPTLIVSLFACLKIGATFLVLDSEQPTERLNHMIQVGAVQCLLKAKAETDTTTLNASAYSLDTIEAEKYSSADLSIAVDGQQGAYIVFTSGSTGYPKGVLVTHNNIASIATAWQTQYSLEQTKVHLQMANTSFDVFCGDWIRALTNGKTLQLCPRNTLLNMPLLLQTLEQNQVDFAEFVPTVLRKLISYLQQKGKTLAMHTIVVASERWTVEDYQRLRGFTNARIINSYGTSETTIDSTYFEVNPQSIGMATDLSDGIPIGKPFSNNRIYVLDNALNPVPIGVIGELYIGGDGVSLGYVNDSEQTQQAFIEHAFANQPSQRLYKTGDLVKWDENGVLHFEGREDKQVKIRGHRIELSEIENVLLSCPGIRQAVVIIQNNAAQEPSLSAYYEVHDGDSVDVNTLRHALAERLPIYMMPAFFQRIDKLPELNNGKINLNGLPKPQWSKTQAEFHAPKTLYETKMAEIWAKMLGVQSVGLYDDFFELGGNSLYLIELMVQIQEAFNIQITVNQLFKLSTLLGMSKTVEEVVTGKIDGALPYMIYNSSPNTEGGKFLFSFPPAGGYSIVYQTLAESMPKTQLVSFNYLTAADKISQYVGHILTLQPQGPYQLFGYSLGGNLAFEVAKELERQGHTVDNVIIMDSYRITDDITISEQMLNDFREELRMHFKKHTGSDKVEEHTMKQANNYIDFAYKQKNLHRVNAQVHCIVEDNDNDPHRANKLKSWDGSSNAQSHLHIGVSLHEDMLLGDNAVAHASIINGILKPS
jgi:hybrid polyketide synthase/nonribosomal peptide synthetase FtdB